MATSGTFSGNAVTIGGNPGNYYFTNWQLASQNTAGNYSTINWQTYFHYNASDAQLDNGNTSSNAGTLWSNGGRVHNYAGTFTTRDLLLASGTFTIGHNSDGTQSLSMSGAVTVYTLGASSGSGGWSLPTIPRYSNVTSFTVTSITDESFTLNATCDLSASTINFSIDGGATYSGGGSGTSASQVFHNLASNHTYTCYAHTVNASSGLTAYSGAITPVTLSQGNFLAFL